MNRRITTLLASSLVAGALFVAPVTVAAVAGTECDGTLTGTYNRVVVPDGATCNLLGATVDKSVTVGEGSTLYTKDTNIGQHVKSNGAAQVRLIDTNVYGQIGIQRTVGRVVIGSDGCTADPIAGGNIHLHNNFGNIAICFMTVQNNILVQNNTNTRNEDGGAIGIFMNTVGNNINVSGNTTSRFYVRDNVADNNINCHGNVFDTRIVEGNTAQQLKAQCAQ
jgi:hypothetical protein